LGYLAAQMRKYHFFLYLLILLSASSCWRKAYVHQQPKAKLYAIKANDSNAKYDAFLLPYRKELQQKMNVVVGSSNVQLVKAKPDGNLGHVVCDAMYYGAMQKNVPCDASICNFGGIRVPSVAKGSVSLGTVYEIMPFDNEILVLSITGEQLDTICQSIARSGGMPVSRISFNIVNNTAQDIKVRDDAIDHDAVYNIVVSDYMANGGDNMNILKNLPRTACKMLLRDAIIDYIKYCNANNKPLAIENEKRITQSK
jgi:2',3'-cyclic-nucleotide 2'-phosphodiesterase (5'-nucleotidase family)